MSKDLIMGYSISVPFADENELQKMKNFLNEHKHIISRLHPNIEVYEGKDLPYAPRKKNLLGFHDSQVARSLWFLCSWMAVKSSFRDPKKGLYFYYDDERMPISFDPNSNHTLVTLEGIRVPRKHTVTEIILGLKKEESMQIEILSELNECWNNQLNHTSEFNY